MKKTDQPTDDLPAPREVSEKLFANFFLPWTAVLILVHLVAIYVAPQYLWGVHFYHFFPTWLGWVLTLVALAILIPGIGQFIYGKFAAFAEKIKKPLVRLNPNITFILAGLFSLPLFWIFRTRLPLLGDGYFRIQDLPNGKLHLQEWLDGLIHLEVYRMMIKLIPSWTPELTYAIISVLCGGAFVFISLKLSSFLGKDGFQKVLIFLSLITLGSIQLFFGYVESYTILQVVLLAYLWFSVRCFAGKTGIYPALLALLISIGLHITSLIYLPSFIYLLIKRQDQSLSSLSGKASPAGKQKGRVKKEGELKKTIANSFIIAALFVAAFLMVLWVVVVATRLERTGKGIFIVPLRGTISYPFGMFSLGHISEYVNQLLLLSPLGVSMIIFFLFFKIKYKSLRVDGRFEDRTINFLFLAALLGLAYLFVVNFTLGSADWDLRCSPAPFFVLLGGLLFLRWEEGWSAFRRYAPDGTYHHPPVDTGQCLPPSTEETVQTRVKGKNKYWIRKHTIHTWGVVFICFGLFHTVPWVLINANNGKSVERYMLIQEYDPHPVDETNYNLYNIARILNWAGHSDKVGELYWRATERNPFDTLSYYNLSAWYHKKDDYDSALIITDTLLKIDPNYPKGNWMAGNIYNRKGEFEKALPYLEKAFPFMADNPEFLYDLGMANYWTGRFEQAYTCGEQMIKLAPEYTGGYHILGSAMIQMGDLENAQKAWEQILALDPTDSTAMTNLKMLEEQMKKKGK